MTVIHEFNTPIYLQTPMGNGRAIAMLDYSINDNVVFLVHLDDGRFRCFDSNDVRGMENLTLGIKRPDAPAGGEV